MTDQTTAMGEVHDVRTMDADEVVRVEACLDLTEGRIEVVRAVCRHELGAPAGRVDPDDLGRQKMNASIDVNRYIRR